MKRWNDKTQKFQTNAAIDKFLNEVAIISKEHGLAISHQDRHGAFTIRKHDERFIDWLLDAHDATELEFEE